MNDDGEQDQPVDDWASEGKKVRFFLVCVLGMREEMTHVLTVKHSSHTDGSKIPHEESLFPVLAHLRHQLVHGKNGWDSSKGENHEAEGKESADCQAGAIGIVEFAPRNSSSDKHKSTKVEEDVETVVDFVVSRIRLGEEVSIPIEGVASDEAGNQIVGANRSTGTEDEETDGDREQQVGLLIDPRPVTLLANVPCSRVFAPLEGCRAGAGI